MAAAASSAARGRWSAGRPRLALGAGVTAATRSTTRARSDGRPRAWGAGSVGRGPQADPCAFSSPGAYGLIGSYVAARLHADGHQIVGAGRSLGGARRRGPHYAWVEADF